MNITELNNWGLDNKSKKISNDRFSKDKVKSYNIKKVESNDNVFISQKSYDKFQKAIEVKQLIRDIKKNDNDSESGKNLEEIKKKVESGFYNDTGIFKVAVKKIIKGMAE